MEEKNNELDNLIIDAKKPSPLKKVLLASALLLLVLIIIILITKSLIQTENAPQSSIILPPEPTQEATTEKGGEPLFEEVPIEEEKGQATEVERTIQKAKEAAANASATTPPRQEEESAGRTSETPAVEQPAATAESPQKEAKAPAARTPAPATKPAAPKQSSPTVKSGRYYIQVGAFFRYPPDKKFLASIKKEGYDYVIVEGVRNGSAYKKVLIGPFPDRNAAKSELARVKKRINQNAYVTKK